MDADGEARGGLFLNARFVRVGTPARETVRIRVDGETVVAGRGDTLLTAMLMRRGHVRESEFGGGPRAGFCLMGACQDCWVWTAGGARVRACTTPAEDGMAVFSSQPG